MLLMVLNFYFSQYGSRIQEAAAITVCFHSSRIFNIFQSSYISGLFHIINNILQIIPSNIPGLYSVETLLWQG